MTNSEQLERESVAARSRLEDTLDELRQRITPGQIIDQVFGYAGSGQIAAWANTLGRKAMENPIPVAVLGASMVWLMSSRGNGHAVAERRGDGTGFGRDLSMEGGSFGKAGDRVAGGMSELADSAKDTARGSVGSVTHGVRSAAEGVASAVGSVASTVGEAATGVAGAAKRTAAYVGDQAGTVYGSATQGLRRAAKMVGTTASDVGQGATRTSRSLIDFCVSQPLVLAGIGIAIGAAIGAAFRSTEAENRLVGDTADELKQQAQKLASGPVEAVKSAFNQDGEGQSGNGQGTGTSGQGTGTSGQGTGTSGQGTGTSGQGTGTSGQGMGTSGQGGQSDWRSRSAQSTWTTPGAPGQTGAEGSRQAYQSGSSGQMTGGQTTGQPGSTGFGVPASEDTGRSDQASAGDKRSFKDEGSGPA